MSQHNFLFQQEMCQSRKENCKSKLIYIAYLIIHTAFFVHIQPFKG